VLGEKIGQREIENKDICFISKGESNYLEVMNFNKPRLTLLKNMFFGNRCFFFGKTCSVERPLNNMLVICLKKAKYLYFFFFFFFFSNVVYINT